jgi:hypothetical protein
VAQAWDEGYRAGVNDERMSEANIGIAGFDAKVEPARNNQYRTTLPAQPAPVPKGYKQSPEHSEVFTKAQLLQYGADCMKAAQPAPLPTLVTEEMHVAAVKVLHRANGVDGLPQRMMDAMLAVQPAQPAPVQVPLFWYRPCPGGMYEGPVHNNSVGGKMLRDEKPDDWKPLFTTPPAQRQPLTDD